MEEIENKEETKPNKISFKLKERKRIQRPSTQVGSLFENDYDNVTKIPSGNSKVQNDQTDLPGTSNRTTLKEETSDLKAPKECNAKDATVRIIKLEDGTQAFLYEYHVYRMSGRGMCACYKVTEGCHAAVVLDMGDKVLATMFQHNHDPPTLDIGDDGSCRLAMGKL